MNRFPIFFKILFFIIGLFLIFYGCIPFKSDVENATSEPGLFTSTISPNKTMTQTPYKENIFTPTLIPSRTSTITQIPSFTPLPTFSRSEAKQKIYNLVRDNDGCYLPCWWGITPGITSWNDAFQYLQSLTVKISDPKTESIYENGNKKYISEMRFGYRFSESLGGWGDIVTENQKITFIRINPDVTQHKFLLHQILNDNGKPDNIYIQTDPYTLDNIPPFVLVLLYSNDHFMVEYNFDSKIISGSVYGCPRGIAPWVYIWSSDQTVSEKEIELWALGVDPYFKLRPINTVSDLTINTFYETFLDQNQLNCIQTPIDIW